ncbi:MAG: ABC transporter ATP-binding protein [candidate division Zixibacteria bacterium CG_4_9_14_3_um_filter_46_8]|nr:MAG: ABC transporter ATP-binding protein [candidate division Zixibacteria bacterium CG_4_9_14_3_um_filter_46_8]
MVPALVKLESVSKSYSRDSLIIPVLDNIILKVPKGEFLALMGPSGSGKTTLLNLIAGIDRPSAGDVIVGDIKINDLSESALAQWRSRYIGFVFQFYNLMPVLTAFENVELPLLLTKLSKKERHQHVESALSVVGLEDRMKHYPRQLSGGQEQRVAIARALVTDPTLILADEPTGDLDKISAEEVMVLLSRLNSEFEKTIIMVTHDPRAAEKAHTRKYLDKGELV